MVAMPEKLSFDDVLDKVSCPYLDSFTPSGGRALVRPDPRSSTTQGGIILSDDSPYRVGTVLELGMPGFSYGVHHPLPVAEGVERVIFTQESVNPIEVWDGEPVEEGQKKVYERLFIVPHSAIMGACECEVPEPEPKTSIITPDSKLVAAVERRVPVQRAVRS